MQFYTGCLITEEFYLISLDFWKPFDLLQFPYFFRRIFFENDYEKKSWREEIIVLYKYNVNDKKYEISCKKLSYIVKRKTFQKNCRSNEVSVKLKSTELSNRLIFQSKHRDRLSEMDGCFVRRCFVWRIGSKRFLEHVDDNVKEKPGLRRGEIRTRVRKETRSLLRLPPHDNVTRNYNRRAKWARSRKFMIRGRNHCILSPSFRSPDSSTEKTDRRITIMRIAILAARG